MNTIENPQPLLVAKNVTLRIPIFRPKDRKLLARPLRFLSDMYFSKSQRGVLTILENISLALMPGERLGLIGENGSGKSTLLRVLAGIYQPTEGSVSCEGSVKGMFDISLGMNPEATGLENIYIRGLHMGMKLEAIRELVPEIVSFAELGESIEFPFNTYSSGMQTRLAFSISTVVKPDVLLLDEWIGTADESFNKKVELRMDELLSKSRGLILASHNTHLMQSLCENGIVLHQGKIAFSGKMQAALQYYQEEIV